MKNIILFLFLHLSLSSCGQNALDNTLSKLVSDRIDVLFSEFNSLDSPGYAIGISKNGKTLYKNGYGSANLDYNLPIKTNSSFSIASVSKQFTAACIALLILENKI